MFQNPSAPSKSASKTGLLHQKALRFTKTNTEHGGNSRIQKIKGMSMRTSSAKSAESQKKILRG